MKSFIFLFLFFLSFSLSAQTSVQTTPDVPRGFYTGITTGMLYFLNDLDRQLYGDGWLVGVRAGYDVMKYLSVESHFKFSAHDASPRGQSGIPNSFSAYQALLMLRGGYPVTRRLTVFADLGGGLWHTTPNQKANVGEASRWIMTGGLGLQYFLKIKGLAMGIDPSLSAVKDLNGALLQLTGYVRYTF